MWLTPETAAERVGIDKKTLSEHWKGAYPLPEGCKPLRISRLPPGRLILIKPEWIDEYIEQFATQGSLVDAMCDELLAKMGKGSARRKGTVAR